jgi:hypothetical protein
LIGHININTNEREIMGVSTDGIICYGYMFPEGWEFPWHEYDSEDEWWEDVNGYIELKIDPEPYTEVGCYQPWFKNIPELEKDRILEPRFKHHRKWSEEHPWPVYSVNYCSGECPMYILAVPSSVTIAKRGYPEQFEPSDLDIMKHADELVEFQQFIEKYCILKTEDEYFDPPKLGWWLCSYWG